MNKTYTSSEFAKAHHLEDKTFRNYLRDFCKTHGVDTEKMKTIGAKGRPEYRFTEEQNQILDIIFNPKADIHPYLKPDKPLEKFTEADMKRYSALLFDGIENLDNQELKNSLTSTFEYKAAEEMRRSYEEFEELRDEVLYIIEQLPLDERLDVERQILEKTRVLARNLMAKLGRHLAKEAMEQLGISGEARANILECPPSTEIQNKSRQLMMERIENRKKNVDFNYGGYNLLEKALARALENTLK